MELIILQFLIFCIYFFRSKLYSNDVLGFLSLHF